MYGGGGNSGATYTNDYIQLTNRGSAAVDLSAWSVQYASASGTTWLRTDLTGSIAAGGSYLIQEAAGSGGTTALPAPDVTGTIAMSASSGKVALVTSQATLACGGSCHAAAGVRDFVGYGAASDFEGSGPAPGLSNTTAGLRGGAGSTDTDDNAADFTPGQPDPGSGQPEPPAEVAIAGIQGTGDVSPYAGRTVRTAGVVTAAYSSGGFNGYYLQTPGTGGDTDPAARTASDAVFVFSSATVGQVRIGDHVEVTGTVSEFFGLTEISVGAGAARVLSDPAEAVKPVPFALPRDTAMRERYEGMLVQPAGSYVVSDTFNLGGFGNNAFGEIVLASGDQPLIQPTDVARPGAAADAVAADNAARRVVLDDGQSIRTPSSGQVPYLTTQTPVRTGARVTFGRPVIFDFRNDSWKFQPTQQLTGGASADVSFQDTRTAAPQDTGGAARLASFNVLNYFTTLGVDVAGCEPFTDREGNPISVSGGCDARGAWDSVNLARQQGKIVAAVNQLDADVVALEEIENSAKFGKNRDDALSNLVGALNAAAGAGTWDYVRSPSLQPALDEQDVIRTAFIYRPAAVRPVGSSTILTDSPAFANAREPLAQEFALADGGKRFLVIANHFKSKGCGDSPDPGDGQGCFNQERQAQASALAAFADRMVAQTGTAAVFLIGDFNSYTREDPLQVLYQAGYADLNATFAHKNTYVFDETVGSLDHILASPAAVASVTGVDVWNINSVESVLGEYSRYNYFAGNLFSAGTPYRSSDHDPILVGLSATPSCSRTISGRYTQPLTVPSGVTCLTNATVLGPIRVERGAELYASGSQVVGAVTAVGASSVTLRDSTLIGPATISATTRQVWLAGSTVLGPVTVRQTSSATAPVIAGNHIIGSLACTGNSPAPTNNGDRNVVVGPATGQCAKL
ncbi:hypothetical protein GCM10027569_17390 [Flindersiella endophytica]